MLNKKGISYRYREYTEEPLNEQEIAETLSKLRMKATEVLRRNDPAFQKLGLSGTEAESFLIEKMAEYPTLLQRPIGVVQEQALVGRPPERLLDLIEA